MSVSFTIFLTKQLQMCYATMHDMFITGDFTLTALICRSKYALGVNALGAYGFKEQTRERAICIVVYEASVKVMQHIHWFLLLW